MHKNTADRKGRVGFLAAAIIGIALIAAACGGRSNTASAPTAESTTYQNALAFAQCMRTHGEPSWPKPTSQGNFNASQIDISSRSYMQSSVSCAFLRPPKIKILESAAQQREVRQRLLMFAKCMRSHGFANFLGALNQGKPRHSSSAGPALDTSSPFFRSAMKTCGAVKLTGGWWVSGT